MRAETAPGHEDASKSQRALGETLARQVAEMEGSRLWWMRERVVNNATPIGFRLLNAIPSPGLRFGVGAGFVGVFAGALLVAFRYRHLDASVEGLALLAAFLVASLFLPNVRRRGWWSDD